MCAWFPEQLDCVHGCCPDTWHPIIHQQSLRSEPGFVCHDYTTPTNNAVAQNAVNIAAHTYACRKRLHEITQQLHIHSTAVDFGEQHSRDADLICDPGAASLSTLAIAMSSDSGHHCEQQSLQLWCGH